MVESCVWKGEGNESYFENWENLGGGYSFPAIRGKRGAKRGFTLVEVIVVLVILAILAAIAIPALTGYIDKTQYAKTKAEFRNFIVALQSVLSEAYADPQTEVPPYSKIFYDGKQIAALEDDAYGGDPYALIRVDSDYGYILQESGGSESYLTEAKKLLQSDSAFLDPDDWAISVIWVNAKLQIKAAMYVSKNNVIDDAEWFHSNSSTIPDYFLLNTSKRIYYTYNLDSSSTLLSVDPDGKIYTEKSKSDIFLGDGIHGIYSPSEGYKVFDVEYKDHTLTVKENLRWVRQVHLLAYEHWEGERLGRMASHDLRRRHRL